MTKIRFARRIEVTAACDKKKMKFGKIKFSLNRTLRDLVPADVMRRLIVLERRHLP